MATPHINAEMGDFADVVLMPGDPLRAKFIAETYLDNVRQVCDIRNMYGYTGTYKGRPISVMGHGMGIPSCSIYIKELITDFGVKKVIRVGSCGAVRRDIHVRDIVIGLGGCTDSKVNRTRFKGHDFAAIAEANNLLAAVVDNALHYATHDIDPRSICIRRAIDVNDRALRDVVVGIGGRTGGVIVACESGIAGRRN